MLDIANFFERHPVLSGIITGFLYILVWVPIIGLLINDLLHLDENWARITCKIWRWYQFISAGIITIFTIFVILILITALFAY